jgi:aspartate dehydrogenase
VRVGFIGFGTIAAGVLALLQEADDISVVGAIVRDPLKPRMRHAPPVFDSVDELARLRPEVVVEAGGHAALARHGPDVLRRGIDLILLSVGALGEREVEEAIVAAARAGHSRAIVASGAIGGLDALTAAVIGGLDRVTHTTRKPASALLPPAEAAGLKEPLELFCGSARSGVLQFPENINVVAAVSLAGIGFDRTQVRVIADPRVTRNTHRVLAEGMFGEFQLEIRNVPTDENPRTGRLVAMSVLSALRRRHTPLVIG